MSGYVHSVNENRVTKQINVTKDNICQDISNFSCEQCDLNLLSKKHYINSINFTLLCEQCKHRKSEAEYLKTQIEKLQLSCDDCHNYLTGKSNLIAHKYQYHQNFNKSCYQFKNNQPETKIKISDQQIDESINLNDSILSDFNCDISNINQLDGNASIDSQTNSSITSQHFQTNSHFRIIEANVNSIKGKKEELKAIIQLYKPDCLILVETKLDSSYSSSEFFDLNKWNVAVRKDRNIYGGGIIIAVLRKYIVSPVDIKYDGDDNPELFWIKLHSIKNQKPVYICGLYRSQRDLRSANMINCLRESIMKIPGKKGQQHLVILGDANLHIDWKNNQPMENSFTKPLDEKMLELCDDINLTQKVFFPTRLDQTLDILLSSDPNKVINVQQAPPLADHDLVIADLDLCIKKKPNSQRVIYMWNKTDKNELSKYVSEKISTHNFGENSDIDANWNVFKNILQEARDKFVPHKLSTTRHNLPWYNQNLRRLTNKKQRLYNKMQLLRCDVLNSSSTTVWFPSEVSLLWMLSLQSKIPNPTPRNTHYHILIHLLQVILSLWFHYHFQSLSSQTIRTSDAECSRGGECMLVKFLLKIK